MSAFQDWGLKVPDDISITGFDGLPFSAISNPSLTTVNVSCFDMDYWSERLLLKNIKDNKRMPFKLLVDTQLNVRE